MDDILPAAQIDQSTRTSSHRSARSDRIEIVTRSERRRWSLEQKREIVAESLGPGLTPTEVARKYAISSGQLYTWRRELLSMQTSIITRATPRFAEVETEPAPLQHVATQPAPAAAHPPCTSAASPRPDGLIELVMPSGMVVRMDAHVDGRALRRILGALEER
jgi:transposase